MKTGAKKPKSGIGQQSVRVFGKTFVGKKSARVKTISLPKQKKKVDLPKNN